MQQGAFCSTPRATALKAQPDTKLPASQWCSKCTGMQYGVKANKELDRSCANELSLAVHLSLGTLREIRSRIRGGNGTTSYSLSLILAATLVQEVLSNHALNGNNFMVVARY